jgi:hypothetical protein
MLGGWRAYHVFYHGDQCRLLRHLLIPLVQQLLAAGVIDRFYFVRYGLGGPHVRLRWRLLNEAAGDAAEAALAERARLFFAVWPSTSTLADERVRTMNRSLEPANQAEADTVYPDNTWRCFPVQFEIERYGGSDRLPASLDLFALTSAHVLRDIAAHGECGKGWTSAAMLRSILQLAWGLTEDEERGFLSLAGYGERFMGPHFAPCAERAASFFGRQRQGLTTWVRRELENPDDKELASGGYHVARQVAGLAVDARWYLAASHIHMTANRLGVTNAEEVYLSRMLQLALEALREEAPGWWHNLWNARLEWAQQVKGSSLTQVTASSMAALIEDTCR